MATLSAKIPPPLPSRSPTTTESNYNQPSTPTSKPPSGCCKESCIHFYDEITVGPEDDKRVYESLSNTQELNLDLRLKKVEDNQSRATLEFNRFCDDVRQDIKLLKTSVNELKLISKSMEQYITESLTNLQKMTEKMQLQMLENSDHLGKQILDVRRDIVAVSKINPSTFKKH